MKFLRVFADIVNPTDRVEILQNMHNLVVMLNDEDFYYQYWIEVVPDMPTKEDFIDIAENDEIYTEVVKTFLDIMTIVRRDEIKN